MHIFHPGRIFVHAKPVCSPIHVVRPKCSSYTTSGQHSFNVFDCHGQRIYTDPTVLLWVYYWYFEMTTLHIKSITIIYNQ